MAASSSNVFRTKESGLKLQDQSDTVHQLSSGAEPTIFGLNESIQALDTIEKENQVAKPFKITGVAFRNLHIYGFLSRRNYMHTFVTAPTTLLAITANAIRMKRERKLDSIRSANGLVRRGEMLVVLGRPGSGCSTLLKSLSGETRGVVIDPSSTLRYQGISLDIPQSALRGQCIYTAEQDTHFPELTVAETIQFAAEARVPRECRGTSREGYVECLKGFMLDVFELSMVKDTKIGNEIIRGISGGERKRLSIAEAMIGLGPLQCWDNATRGMDSSTALKLIQLLKAFATERGTISIVSLYQASQQILDLFEKVTVMYDGQQIFFGTMEAALSYFNRLGFNRPDKMTTGDFLTSVTNPIEAEVLRDTNLGNFPRSADDFAALWQQSKEKQDLLAEIDRLESKDSRRILAHGLNQRSPAGRRPSTSPYSISIGAQILLCVRRGIRRLMNNIVLPVSTVLGNVGMALIVGSMFYNLDNTTRHLSSRSILIFFSVLLNGFMTAFEVLTIWSQRPVVEKQARFAFYHPFVEAVSAMVCDLPAKLAASIFFNLTLYFLTNLRRTIGSFFIFWTFSFVCMMTMSMLFRCVGSLARTLNQVMVPFGVMMISFITYAGFVIPKLYMLPWLRWIVYLNPIAYAFESLMINEFHGRWFDCQDYIPYGPSYKDIPQDQKSCSSVGASQGGNSVDGGKYVELTFSFHYVHLWRNLWILLLFMAIFCGVHIISSEYILAEKGRGNVVLYRHWQNPAARKSYEGDEEAQDAHSSKHAKPTAEVQRQSRLQFSHNPSPTTVYWSNLCYHIDINGKQRRLLTNVDGWVKPGTLTALMGATGAGKTTLLDALANRTFVGQITGEIIVDGHPRDIEFEKTTGYVQQQDIHHSAMTVRETLQFSALMRQPQHIPKNEKLSYVEEVIEMLEMSQVADGIVGTLGNGLDVEQRRRLSIGVELAAKPKLLFLDEPTSGLDSQTAWIICSLLRKLASQGQAILCTIHQPSVQLFEIFDRLLLIEKEGKTLYFGDVGRGARAVISYFEENGARPCQSHENPAEWMFEVTTCADNDWSRLWQDSREREGIRKDLSSMSSVAHATRYPSTRSSSAIFLAQLQLLLKRDFAEDWRTPSYLWNRLLFCCISSAVIGISCYKAPATLQGLQTQLFAIFLLSTNFSNIMQQIVPAFVRRRNLFEARERQSKTYSWQAFVLSAILTEIVWQLIAAIFAFVLFYYPIGMYAGFNGMEQARRSGLMLLLFCSFFLFTSTLSHALIAGIEHAETAVNIGQLFFYLILIFCGVLVPRSAMPGFWVFMYRISPLTYLVSAMFATAVADKPVVCSEVEMLVFQPPPSSTCQEYLAPFLQYARGTLEDPDSKTQCRLCPLVETNDFLDQLGMTFENSWRYLGFSIVYILFNVLTTLLIYYLARVPKKRRLAMPARREESPAASGLGRKDRNDQA